MTVGIIHTNGKQAIVIADSRASTSGRQTNIIRQSDSINKLKEYTNSNFRSITIGTGNADYVVGTFSDIDNLLSNSNMSNSNNNYVNSNDSQANNDNANNGVNVGVNKSDSNKEYSIDEFVGHLYKTQRDRILKIDNTILSAHRSELNLKANLILDEKEREDFMRSRIGMLMDEYDKSKNENSTNFMISSYDQKNDKIRLFGMGIYGYSEFFQNHAEIGSGSDGANSYLTATLQGVDSTTLVLEDLLFFGLNAHSMSTMNQGVGGTPKIAIITKDNTRLLDYERTLLLANLSGAYISERYEKDFSSDLFVDMITTILSPNYNAVVETLPKDLKDDFKLLKDVYIPFSSWQESSSRNAFKKQTDDAKK
jgi:hypothetical protein